LPPSLPPRPSDPGAPFFNDTTKYVVSGTLTSGSWRKSEIVGPYDAETIRKLKDDVDGDLYVSGSGTLVRALLGDGLVDKLHLFGAWPVRPVAHMSISRNGLNQTGRGCLAR
jgi:dihydrofolate reductase